MDQNQFLDFLFSQTLTQVKEIIRVAQRYELELEDIQKRTKEEVRHMFAPEDPIKPSNSLTTAECSNESLNSAVNYRSDLGNRAEAVCYSKNDLLNRRKVPPVQPSCSSSEIVKSEGMVISGQGNTTASVASCDVLIEDVVLSVRKKRPRYSSFKTELAELTIDREGEKSTHASHSAHSTHSTLLHCLDSEQDDKSEVTSSSAAEESEDKSSYEPNEEVSLTSAGQKTELLPRKRQRANESEKKPHVKEERQEVKPEPRCAQPLTASARKRMDS